MLHTDRTTGNSGSRNDRHGGGNESHIIPHEVLKSERSAGSQGMDIIPHKRSSVDERRELEKHIAWAKNSA